MLSILFDATPELDGDLVLNDCRQPGYRLVPPSPAAAARLRPHPLLHTIPLDAEHVVACVPSHSRVAVLGQAALALLRRLPLAAGAGLAELEAAETLAQLGLATDGDGTLPAPPDSDTLTAWMHVTNDCNLRCRYCYIDKSRAAMAPDVARAAVDALVRSALAHGYPAIAIKYAGGEPTLAMPVIEGMHAYAQAQAERHGLRLTAGLLSNGTALSAPKLAMARALGLRLTISLDGLGATNDTQRPTIAGRGSADAARCGVELALAHGVTPHIAVTVTGASVAGLPELVSWLLERDLRFGISFYRENDCSASLDALRLDEQRIVAGMRAAYEVVAAHPPRWSVLDALLDRADLSAPHGRACAAGHSYLVFDHHGRVAKCQMEIGRPVASVTAHDPLALLRADPRGVQSIPVEQKEGCRDCAWRFWCAGGCPIATFRATGRYDVRSPNCGIYQALYPDLLRLEGLRLLHWQQVAAGGSL